MCIRDSLFPFHHGLPPFHRFSGFPNGNFYPLTGQSPQMAPSMSPFNPMVVFPNRSYYPVYNANISAAIASQNNGLINLPHHNMIPYSSYMSQTIISPINIPESINGQIPQNCVPTSESQKTTPLPITALDDKEEKKEIKLNNETLEDGSNQSICRRLLAGEAYKSRNVYKTIVRHMYAYIRKNRTEIIQILQNSGFTMTEIEHAFFKVDYWCNLERQNGNRNYAQGTVKKIFAKKSIYTIIMRETLYALLHCWEQGKYGKIHQKNCVIYQKACQKFYDETVNILGQPAQGKCFELQQLPYLITFY
eukprot:TRINITY_DN1122_c0_g1_i11.p1 TRINITY_DN1122_c0_g1~~TRINITY_DN1122_c0_g1_i11.p1  ORF type:complete len:306 (+),score=32.19 TRINITY_DN1122_c0_g1_i11:64-981(+)